MNECRLLDEPSIPLKRAIFIRFQVPHAPSARFVQSVLQPFLEVKHVE
jgi:hypothetical protein